MARTSVRTWQEPEPEREVPWEADAIYTGEPIIAWRAWTVTNVAHLNGPPYPGLTVGEEGDGMLLRVAALEPDARRAGVPLVDYLRQPRLAAVGIAGHEWKPREKGAAECVHMPSWAIGPLHAAPAADCHCGFWGFRDLADVRHALGCGLAGRRLCYALGTVSMWGRIVETERGYRAQHAYPREVELVGGSEEQAAELSRLYGVPVVATPAPVRPDPPDPYTVSVSFAVSSKAHQAAVARVARAIAMPQLAMPQPPFPDTRPRWRRHLSRYQIHERWAEKGIERYWLLPHPTEPHLWRRELISYRVHRLLFAIGTGWLLYLSLHLAGVL